MGFKRTSKDLGNTKGFTGGDKKPRIDELVDQFKYPNKKWAQVRPLGPVFGYSHHWIEIKTKDGQTKIPKQCLAYDDVEETIDSTKKCPYCDLGIKPTTYFYVNAIIRDAQEDEPKKKPRATKEEDKSGFKDKDSDTWTPVKVLRLPGGLAAQFSRLADLNKRKNKKTGKSQSHPISDPKFGCDVQIMYDSKAAGTAKYVAQKGDASPLTDDEQAYLLWNIEEMEMPEALKAAQTEAKDLKKKMIDAPDEDEDDEEGDDEYEGEDDEDDEPKSKKGKKPAKGKKKPKDEDEEEEDEEEEEEDEEAEEEEDSDDDEDEDSDEDSDDDEDEDEADEDEDSDEDSDDDEDEDEADEDEEDDEPATKKKSKSKSKPEPVKKGKKPVKKAEKPAKGKKKKSKDDDFNFDD